MHERAFLVWFIRRKTAGVLRIGRGLHVEEGDWYENGE